MTEVRYEDRYGNGAVIQDIYQVPVKKDASYNDVVASWFGNVNEKEQHLIEHVKKNGGRVLSVISQPISKRRYKRKTAKAIKINEKILSSLQDDIEE